MQFRDGRFHATISQVRLGHYNRSLNAEKRADAAGTKPDAAVGVSLQKKVSQQQKYLGSAAREEDPVRDCGDIRRKKNVMRSKHPARFRCVE